MFVYFLKLFSLVNRSKLEGWPNFFSESKIVIYHFLQKSPFLLRISKMFSEYHFKVNISIMMFNY